MADKLTKIYSMASNDLVIPDYEKRTDSKESSPNVIKEAIIITGGANVAFSADKHKRNSKFAVTEVTADQLKFLQSHPSFKRRVENGFISISEQPKELKADKSAQITEKQMKAKAPNAEAKTGAAEQ